MKNTQINQRSGPMDSRLTVDVSASRRFRGLRRRVLASRSRQACSALGLRSGEVSIRLADDAEMSRLHWQHKSLAGPTDVLTFDFTEPGPGRPGHLEVEIVVGAEVAQREARQRGQEPGLEALLYVVHGLLHCLGHDDHDPKKAAAMHRREDEVLKVLGLRPAYRPRRQPGSRRRL